MGRKRKAGVEQQLENLKFTSGEYWGSATDEPLNITRITIEAMQALSDAGKGELAGRLMDAYQQICDHLYEEHWLREFKYKMGVHDGFGLGKADVHPPQRSDVLACAVWKHLQSDPSMTSKRLCRLLEDQRRQIDVPRKYAQRLPKDKWPSFPNLLKYSHAFQQYLSEQRKQFDA